MAYLKFLDHDNHWHRIMGVQSLSEIGNVLETDIDLEEYGVDEVEYLGASDGSKPLFLFLETNNDNRVVAMNARQAFLCSEETGSTIDAIVL